MKIEHILSERGNNYGDFRDQAIISQSFKHIIAEFGEDLSTSQREALEMIVHKIARILNGNPNYKDSWVDIVGYAQLVVNELESDVTEQ